MSTSRIIVAVCLCLLLSATPASGKASTGNNPYQKAIVKARSGIWHSINSGKCGSAAVAVTAEGRIVYSEGFGMADREKSMPVSPSTIFNIGSISKVFAATAIMLLVDDGRVALDRPVTDYLPDFRMADDRYRKITVRMLLNHQSGLPGTSYGNAFAFEYDNGFKRQTLDTLSRAHLKHDPGAHAAYCNDGFTLAEMIVERVTGGRYIDFLDRRVFRRLGMKKSGMGVGTLRGKPVALYYNAVTGKMHPPETASVLGAGGLSSTAEELCRFADAFSAENRLLKKASLGEMRKAQPPAFPGRLRSPVFSTGLGWDFTGLPRYDAAGIQVLGKGGRTGDYSSFLFTLPDSKISIAVTATGAQTDAISIALTMLDAILVEKRLIAAEDLPLFIPPAAQKLPQDHAEFGGYYGGDSFSQAVFDESRNSLTFYGFREKEKVPLMTLVYNNGYYHDPQGNRYYFTAAGGESLFVTHQPQFKTDKIMLQKIKPLDKPQSLRTGMDGRIWLRRNVSPSEAVMLVETHLVKSLLYKDLPGYVVFNGVKRIDSPDFAGMPFDAIRDQTELALIEKNGSTWAQVSDMLYSPADGAASMKAGDNHVRIGRNGYSEWMAAKEGMVLSFTKPGRGRIIVFSPKDTVTYDSVTGTGDVYVAGGSYIECAGLAGDSFTVRARPAVTGEKGGRSGR